MASKLVNIRFASTLAEVKGIRPGRVLIRWELEPTAQDISNLQFFIHKGETDSELRQQNAKGVKHDEAYEYLDYNVMMIDMNKNYEYQVHAVEFDDDGNKVQTFKSETFGWGGDLDITGLYVVDEHLYLYRHCVGVPFMIFRRRREGTRCPACWDKILKRVTSSNCLTCYGTGYSEGYYPAIEAWAHPYPAPKIANVAQYGEHQSTDSEIEFTNYPDIRIGDIMVELKPNIYWRVANVRFTEKNKTVMTQKMSVRQIHQSDIEYTLQIDEDRRTELLDELEERRALSEF